MLRIFTLLLLVTIALTGCRKNPPSDWQAPGLGISRAGQGECTESSHDVTLDLTDGGATRAVRLVNDLQITGAIETISTKLIEDKKTTKASDLTAQLSKEKCTAELAKPGTNQLTSAQIYDQCSASVLIFSGVYKCGKCAHWHAAPASGFVLTESGIAVTNHHVLEKSNNETYVAMTLDGKIFPVKEVLAASKKDDLAIVQLDLPEGVKLKPLAVAEDAPVGSPITLISHPDGRFYTLTTGIISRHHIMGRGKVQMPTVTITADYARGSSGAPVLSDRGAVVGVVASTHSVYYNNEGGKQENLQMVFKQCIPSASLLKLIEAKK